MKKLITSLVAVLFIAIILAPVAKAEPTPLQVVPLCNQCCDGYGVARCGGWILACGAACRCAGIPGFGYAC